MASPVLETLCCYFQKDDGNETVWGNVTHANFSGLHPSSFKGFLITYNVLSIISSSLSISAAIYQLIPKKSNIQIRTEREKKSALRQNYVICWLTVADLVATIGVLIRSSYWLNRQTLSNSVQHHSNQSEIDHLFCAVSSGFIQFFYISTYFWTFTFALDTYLLTVNKSSRKRLYHLLCWGISAALCSTGLAALYTPSPLECQRSYGHLLPHFFSYYIPLLFTMIVNPILYAKVTKSVQTHMYGSGLFTDREREILRSLKMRFRAIMITFYVCWLPTVVSGVVVPFYWKPGMLQVSRAILLLTGILNPLQGFFNSLLYNAIGLCPSKTLRVSDIDQTITTNDTESSTRLLDSTESAPLYWEYQSQ